MIVDPKHYPSDFASLVPINKRIVVTFNEDNNIFEYYNKDSIHVVVRQYFASGSTKWKKYRKET